MKTLYISDLDGTLLRSDERVSEYTASVINEIVGRGELFSCATARSLITAGKVLTGVRTEIPLIVYNGVFVRDIFSGRILLANYFGEEIKKVIADLVSGGIYPVVYSMKGEKELFSYVRELCSKETLNFLSTRKNDPRDNPVSNAEQLFEGDIFYISCIDKKEKLEPFFHKYRDSFQCLFQSDVYSGDQWLEMLPSGASKASAALRLKEILGCDRIVAFGDGLNDMELFSAADECYAVENAVPELKAIADGVIGGNNEDGVARWLENRLIEKNM